MPEQQLPACPNCRSTNTYPSGELLMCPDCGQEWNADETELKTGLVVKDANGNILQDGDAVVVIKNLPVKGSP